MFRDSIAVLLLPGLVLNQTIVQINLQELERFCALCGGNGIDAEECVEIEDIR